MTLLDKLAKIHAEMKAPKDLYNSFGKYKYRNAESILETFKPFEEKYKVLLTIEDHINHTGAWHYVEATARLYDRESDDVLIITSSAREAETKAGMDSAQITGAASSYARKYALNALFLLDDTKDPDTNELKVESDARAADERKKELIRQAFQAGVETRTICEMAGVKDLGDIDEKTYERIIAGLRKKIEEKNGAQSQA